MRVLIIEDEHFAQNELKRLLKKIDDSIHIVECIDSIEDSVQWLSKNEAPDLIFLDIQLSDGLSFEIFNQVKIETPIIFTTAYDEYAINAFKLNSIDYLLKPIKEENLKQALEKFKTLKNVFKTDDVKIESLLSLLKQDEKKNRFLVKIGDQIKFVDTDDISFFIADNNIVFLYEKSGKRSIVDYTLEQIEKTIDPKQFFRISRKLILKISCIKKISKHLNGRLKLEIEPYIEEEIFVSRSRVSNFLNWIDQ
jgi:two-component system, LytTR family, response regulator